MQLSNWFSVSKENKDAHDSLYIPSEALLSISLEDPCYLEFVPQPFQIHGM